MSEETRLAFAHPLERAKATEGAAMLDRISLRSHIVDVEIGAFQAERGLTQRISFDIVVEVRQMSDELEDDVDRILSYDRVTEAIDAELAAERLNLLETLAERVADRILREPQAQRVFVRIEKLDRGGGALGVEIVRAKADVAAGAATEQDDLHPRVVFLSETALHSEHVSKWIDQLAAQDAPLVFCVDAPESTAASVDHEVAQRRIDLLAIEQNAWRFAARDTRCAVVGTKTELDWAMRNEQICVWAPSKIVLDSVDGALDTLGGAASLAAWFAKQFAACEIVFVGAPVITGISVPSRMCDVDADHLI